MKENEIELTVAEVAMLKFWRNYVPCFDPTKRQYLPEVHSIEHRTMLYYFITEDLIEYFRVNKIHGSVGYALNLMHVQSSTLAEWRAKWGDLWRNLQLF